MVRGATTEPQDPDLADARRRIDSVDQQLVALLNARARIVDEVSRIKKARGIPLADERRFQEVVEKAACYSQGPLPPEAVKQIYQRLVEAMQAWEESR